MKKVKFGTDGWRAIINEDFNDENIAQVIQAFSDIKQTQNNKKIYIGYDRRNKAETSAKFIASILAKNNFTPILASSFCPTPCISWMVKENDALAGIIVTASHNPANWNGIKFKESYGGAASAEYTNEIEDQIDKNLSTNKKPLIGDYEKLLQENLIKLFDPFADYVTHLQNYLNVSLIQKANYKIAFDPLFGAGTNYVNKILNMDVAQIHSEADITFGGLNPEPIASNLQELKETVLKLNADVGLSTDGDADRIGAFTEQGAFVSSHQIFALLLLHNIRHRQMTGDVIKSISTTGLINSICQKHNLTLVETPIGFKHISQELLKRNGLMGGEESGGISIRDHVLERDGVLNGLLLVEMMAVNNKSLSALIADMDNEFGKFHIVRKDYHLSDDKISAVKELILTANFPAIGNTTPVKHDTRDGTKTTFSDDSWLLARASGTEPLVRVYAEAKSPERVAELHAFAQEFFKIS
ncbi:MAG: phosphoglucomutase/phosphomannomutase family protein [bacterium]